MSSKRGQFFALSIVAAALLLGSCVNRGKTEAPVPVQDTVPVARIDTVPSESGPDRTLYGKGGDFGMSTFTLVAESGRRYSVTRISEKGEEGLIYGSLVPGQRYALLTDADGDALEVLINVDELQHFVHDSYYIYNGQLVLTLNGNREWVDIRTLSPHVFEAEGRGGTAYSFTDAE